MIDIGHIILLVTAATAITIAFWQRREARAELEKRIVMQASRDAAREEVHAFKNAALAGSAASRWRRPGITPPGEPSWFWHTRMHGVDLLLSEDQVRGAAVFAKQMLSTPKRQ